MGGDDTASHAAEHRRHRHGAEGSLSLGSGKRFGKTRSLGSTSNSTTTWRENGTRCTRLLLAAVLTARPFGNRVETLPGRLTCAYWVVHARARDCLHSGTSTNRALPGNCPQGSCPTLGLATGFSAGSSTRSRLANNAEMSMTPGNGKGIIDVSSNHSVDQTVSYNSQQYLQEKTWTAAGSCWPTLQS